jgi:hypothetical protein
MERNRTAGISRNSLAALALILTLMGSAALPRWAAAGTITDANVGQMMAAAKTPADHQALVAYLKGQAAIAAQKVKEHEAWLADLKKPGNVAGKGGASFASHCESLIASYKKQQEDYEAMAAVHQNLAEETAK